jgi:uncharacterized C2H2 Zn-finger protein
MMRQVREVDARGRVGRQYLMCGGCGLSFYVIGVGMGKIEVSWCPRCGEEDRSDEVDVVKR